VLVRAFYEGEIASDKNARAHACWCVRGRARILCATGAPAIAACAREHALAREPVYGPETASGSTPPKNWWEPVGVKGDRPKAGRFRRRGPALAARMRANAAAEPCSWR
jgi:hypothetical protein